MQPLRAAIVLFLAGSASSAFAEQITCESHSGGTEACGTIAAGSSVRVARQLSDTACVEGKNWGTGPDHDSIWVSRGCRAVFDVQPPYDASAGQYDQRAPAPAYRDSSPPSAGSADTSPEWQRGFADAQRGAFDRSSRSGDYRAGYDAGKDALINDQNDAGPASAENYRADEPSPDASAPSEGFRDVEPPAQNRDDGYRGDYPSDDQGRANGYAQEDQPRRERRDGQRYASVDGLRASASRACIDQVASDQSLRPDQIAASDARWVGHGLFEVHLDSPVGQLTCTVDRNGNVHSIDEN
jgi:hypothetical protein